VVFTKPILDIAGYKIGYDFNIGFLKIKHVRVSKVLEMPRYRTFITLFGKEYEKIR
jgi:hypothetical protein